MVVKRPVVLCCVMSVLWALSVACSQTARHRVLSFFFDGVPDPGRSETATGPEAAGRASPEAELIRPAPPRQIVAHTPYRENRCEGCHDSTSGQLIRSVQQGLCLTCHARLTADARFVHGPVAVNDCTVCHHFHGAPFPNLLHVDPQATCLNCHDREDLSAGDHHTDPVPQTCVECHNPHAGDDRFFLNQREP